MYDVVVLGGGPDGLVAAIALARVGSRVALVERAESLGGSWRELEIAPGYRAAPLATDLGLVGPDVARSVGLEIRGVDAPSVHPGLVVPVGREAVRVFADPGATAAALRRYSPADAERWPAFAGLVTRLASVLRAIDFAPAPRVDASGPRELGALLRLGRRVRGLGRHDMVELLRTVPMAVADVLDERFETEALKVGLASLALADLCLGPRAGGTAFGLLHHAAGGVRGGFGPRLVMAAGPAGVIAALEGRARAAGVTIRTGQAVERLLLERERVAGVVLESGEELRAPEVVSSLGPRRTMLDLLDPVVLDPELIDRFRNIRARGARTSMLLALDALPEMPGGADAAGFAGGIVLSPSLSAMERAADAFKYGMTSDGPWLDIRIPSLRQPELAPAGGHVVVIHAQYTPHRLRDRSWDDERDRVGERILRIADSACPGLAARVVHSRLLAPPDIEAEFGLTNGAASQGDVMLDQILFMRPVAGWARHAMPVPGLFLCGPGTHPGPGLTGASGWLAAQAVLRARSRSGGRAAAAGSSAR